MSKNSVLLYIFLSLVVTISVTMYFNVSEINKQYRSYMNNKKQLIKNIVNGSKKQIIEFYTKRLNSVISFDVVKNAIKNNDRELLKKHILKRYKMLKKENNFVSGLVIVDKDNNVIFRGHQPELYGDNVSKYRKVLVAVNDTKKMKVGQEGGLYGAPYRIALPINYKNEHIGAIEISLKPIIFIRNISKVFQEQLYAAMFVNKGIMKNIVESSQSVREGLEKDNYKIPTKNRFFIDNIDKIDADETDYEIIYKNNIYNIDTTYTMNDFQGNLAAKFVIAYNTTELKKAIKDAIIFQILKFIFMLLFIFYVIKKGFDLYEDRLYNQTQKLEKSLTELKQTQKHMIQSEKMAALGGLVAGVAHEINTPIGLGITGITHFITKTKKLKNSYEKEEMSEEDFQKYLKESNDVAEIIYTNLKRSAELVKSFKEISVDQTDEIKKDFNFKEYLEKILLSIHNKTKHKQIDINLDCSDLIVINSYPGVYAQIVTNLIMNSMIHGFENKNDGKIDIIVTYMKDTLSIVYKDNGKGIDKENIKKIFNPFFTTKRDEGGSGLGLNIIYNLITSRLNGTIECKSEIGKSTQFNIKIPLKDK